MKYISRDLRLKDLRVDDTATIASLTVTSADINAGTFTNLTVNDATILGATSADSLTINAGTWTIGSNYTATRAAGTIATGTVTLQQHTVTYTGDAGGNSSPRAWQFYTQNTGANPVNNPIGIRHFLRNSGTGLITHGWSFEGQVWSSNTGGFTQADGFRVASPTVSAGTIGTLRGMRILNQGHASVTTALGILVDDFTNSTTMRAYSGELSSGTGKANLYMSGTADNILRGNVRIGSTTAPTVALDVTGAALISSTLTVTTSITSSNLTSGRLALVGTAGLLTDDAGITYDAAANSITATTFNGGLEGVVGAATPAAATVTNLTVNDATILGATSADTVTVNAETVSQPNIPCFLAYNSADDTNQTGAGAVPTVDFDTEVFDQSGDFSADTFTAPATGKYLLAFSVEVSAIPAGCTSCNYQIVTSNRTYAQIDTFVAGTWTVRSMGLSAVADMDAGDTAIVRVQWSGGAGDTATIEGSTFMVTYFSGVRVA